MSVGDASFQHFMIYRNIPHFLKIVYRKKVIHEIILVIVKIFTNTLDTVIATYV